jgi:3D (Asp-Asp-Asp) domain-containing protein
MAQNTNTKIKARITYYYPEKPWWRKVSDPKTKIAKEGVTVAAHPDFPFGTKVFIPELKNKLNDGTFVVQDRGSAVTSKKAANGEAYVFDVYVSSPKKMHYYAKNVDMWSEVYILN